MPMLRNPRRATHSHGMTSWLISRTPPRSPQAAGYSTPSGVRAAFPGLAISASAMPASCVICHRASGLHSPECPIGQQLKDTRAQLLSIADAHRETEGARRRGNRGGFNPALRQVNVTAFPAVFHPLKGVPVKLPGMNAHNVVLEMDATYEDVVSALQRALFYAYVDADFELCTSDGALIAKDTPFKLFPFNINSSRGGGRKHLWLVRKEEFDQTDNTEYLCPSSTVDAFSAPALPGGLSPLPASSIGPLGATLDLDAFGDLTSVPLDTLLQSCKGDDGAAKTLAILRRYNGASGKWTHQMLDTFRPPNLEDPVEDGEYKSVFKDALFEPVFGDQTVVFKVSRDERDDRLSTISREVQIAAVCRKLQQEFNAAAPKAYQVEFSDCCVIELLPDSIDLTLLDEHPIRMMAQRGSFWIVERQLRSKTFSKFISNEGAIVPVGECRSSRAKADRMAATAFAHFSWVQTSGKAMVLDIQGGQRQYTDAQIITSSDAAATFGNGNLGKVAIDRFFMEHQCNLVCAKLGIDNKRLVVTRSLSVEEHVPHSRGNDSSDDSSELSSDGATLAKELDFARYEKYLENPISTVLPAAAQVIQPMVSSVSPATNPSTRLLESTAVAGTSNGTKNDHAAEKLGSQRRSEAFCAEGLVAMSVGPHQAQSEEVESLPTSSPKDEEVTASILGRKRSLKSVRRSDHVTQDLSTRDKRRLRRAERPN